MLMPTVEYGPPLATQNEPSFADTRSLAAIITPLQHYDETTTNKTRTYNILTFWFQPKVFQLAISLLNTHRSADEQTSATVVFSHSYQTLMFETLTKAI
jgi:hypothetical protein